MNNEEKSYRNKDLIGSKEDFEKSITNDFIGDDFTERLEWAMLMIQGNFKQMRFADYLPMVTKNHFDKAYLMTHGLSENIKFFAPYTQMQATPEIFPNINIKFMTITDTIQLNKIKELDSKEKRHLTIKRKHAYQISSAFFKKDTESFYGINSGYEINDSFFKIGEEGRALQISDLPKPISLHPNYTVPENAIQRLEAQEIIDMCNLISGSYQAAMSMYYEWSIYIKEYDNIGMILPIDASILSEIYRSSMLKFDNKKRMLHFVREHYRRKVANPNEDYSIFIQKYLRGEHKFDYRGFYTEIIPPKYDLNRIKTRKKFIDANA